jgi:hypothetical protein
MAGFAGALAGLGEFAQQENERKEQQWKEQRTAITGELKAMAKELAPTDLGWEVQQLLMEWQMSPPGGPPKKPLLEKFNELMLRRNQYVRSGVEEEKKRQIADSQAQLQALTPPPFSFDAGPATSVPTGVGAGQLQPSLPVPPMKGVNAPLTPLPPPPDQASLAFSQFEGMPSQPQVGGPAGTRTSSPYAEAASLRADLEIDKNLKLFEGQQRIRARLGDEKAQKFLDRVEGIEDPSEIYKIAVAYGFPVSAHGFGGGPVRSVSGVMSGKDLAELFPEDPSIDKTEG